MVCYHCQQPRHIRRDCPQRKGSQGFGTAQSQSIVGHERIQYVPPPHGTGQRGQSQFQGATRAPHISQAGPIGQSNGRGRGRGPQAGTSGVQGRASHSFIAASVVIELGLEVETLEEPLYVSSLLGIRARIWMICRGWELEISGTLLTMDQRIMDMSEFDVILRMDWLTAYRVVIDCERRRVTAYT